MIKTRSICLFLFLGFAKLLPAATSYYVDPDWTGAQSGTQAQPWNVLNAGTWATINAGT